MPHFQQQIPAWKIKKKKNPSNKARFPNISYVFFFYLREKISLQIKIFQQGACHFAPFFLGLPLAIT